MLRCRKRYEDSEDAGGVNKQKSLQIAGGMPLSARTGT